MGRLLFAVEPDDVRFSKELSGDENLSLIGGIFVCKRLARACKICGCTARASA